MRWKLLPGSSNVYRFPMERGKADGRSLAERRADVREVSLVAEAFGLDEPPMEIRNASDRAMAERIAATTGWPEDARAKRAALARGGLEIGRCGREARVR
jgi:hypothetical protein